jgi:hypothetical protein
MADSEGNDSNPVTIQSSVGESEIIGVFAHTPVIYGEDAAAYTQLTTKILAVIKPGDFIEEMFARDVIDLFWEVTRLRRLKAGLLDANRGKGLRELLNIIRNTDAFEKDTLSAHWAGGRDGAREKVAGILANAGLSDDAIMGQTLSLSIDSIDRMIA